MRRSRIGLLDLTPAAYLFFLLPFSCLMIRGRIGTGNIGQQAVKIVRRRPKSGDPPEHEKKPPFERLISLQQAFAAALQN